MGFALRVRPEHGLGVGWFFGPVGAGEAVTALAAMYRSPAWAPGFATAWDALALTALDLAPQDFAGVEALLGELRPVMGQGRAALVVRRGSVEAEVAGLIETKRRRRGGRPTGVFHDRASAAAWLGVPVEALAPPASERPDASAAVPVELDDDFW